jgi:hypothetical protein
MTPDIDPLLSPAIGLTIDPRLAGDGVGVASKDPLLAPLAPRIVGCDNLLSPGRWTCRFSSDSDSVVVGTMALSDLRGNRCGSNLYTNKAVPRRM